MTIGIGLNDYVYLVYISPAVVITKEVLYVESTTYPFEVSSQKMTFGLPVGYPRVMVEELDEDQEFDTEGCKVFSVHDIVDAPELYGRLLAMVSKKSSNSSAVYTAYDEYGCTA